MDRRLTELQPLVSPQPPVSCLMVYLPCWEAGVERQIAPATGLFDVFHFNNWFGPTQIARNQRGLMDDGVIDITRLRGLIEDAGYDVCKSLSKDVDDGIQRQGECILCPK